MFKKLISTLFIFFLFLSAKGQIMGPLDLAKKIFSRDEFTDISIYISDDLKELSDKKRLPDGYTTEFLLLEQKEKQAVVSMTTRDSIGQALDMYLFFEKDSVWKLGQLRHLAMTGIIERCVADLEKMSSNQIDSLVRESGKKRNKDRIPFSSREEFNFLLGSFRLILEQDKNIIKHFESNREGFDRLKDHALNELKGKEISGERGIVLIEDFKADYRRLFISSVSYGDYETGNHLTFSIGGMLDNTVGYMYVPDKNNLPEMNPSRIIMIREIGNGWYMYKTT